MMFAQFSTGKVLSDRQSFVSYEGELQSKTEYRWEVTVWDNHGNEAKAESL